jgi:hypothetical protein
MDKSGTQDAGSTGGLWEGALIEPPRGPIEVGARLSTFWWIFRVDRAISVMTGLPSSFLDEVRGADYPRFGPLTFHSARKLTVYSPIHWRTSKRSVIRARVAPAFLINHTALGSIL